MGDIMALLYDYICENTDALRSDPEYDRVVQAYLKVEEEVKQKLGEDLLQRYQSAEADLTRRQDLAVFAHTLRLGHRFMLEVLA